MTGNCMKKSNELFSKALRLNWSAVSVIAALICAAEILWIRALGMPATKSYSLILLPIPFQVFVVAFFMWSMASYKRKRTRVNSIQLIFSGVVLIITTTASFFWMIRKLL